jgi:hypothetical protein
MKPVTLFVIFMLLFSGMAISFQSVMAQTVPQEPHGITSGGSGDSAGADFSSYWILLTIVAIVTLIIIVVGA